MKSISQYGEILHELSKFVAELDESVRAEAFKFLLNQELGHTSTSTGAGVVSVKSQPTDRNVAPQELIRRSGISTFTQKAVVLAHWLEQYQQKKSFTSGDLKTAFEQAREPAPKNPSDLVAQLEATARIMKADNTGSVQHYRLTSTAMQDVERWLSAHASKKK